MAALQSCLPSRECAAYYRLSHEDRARLVRQSAPDRQLDLFYCGLAMEPPDLTATEVLADQGRKALPEILERLAAETADSRRHNLIFMLDLMSMRHPDVGRDQEVLEAIRQSIRKFDRPDLRQLSEESLRRIEDR